jgi:hypothetical protein
MRADSVRSPRWPPNAVTGNHGPGRRQPIRVLADLGLGLVLTVVVTLWAISK